MDTTLACALGIIARPNTAIGRAVTDVLVPSSSRARKSGQGPNWRFSPTSVEYYVDRGRNLLGAEISYERGPISGTGCSFKVTEEDDDDDNMSYEFKHQFSEIFMKKKLPSIEARSKFGLKERACEKFLKVTFISLTEKYFKTVHAPRSVHRCHIPGPHHRVALISNENADAYNNLIDTKGPRNKVWTDEEKELMRQVLRSTYLPMDDREIESEIHYEPSKEFVNGQVVDCQISVAFKDVTEEDWQRFLSTSAGRSGPMVPIGSSAGSGHMDIEIPETPALSSDDGNETASDTDLWDAYT